MNKTQNTLLVGVETVQADLGISKAKAYQIIREINKRIKEKNPDAVTVAGKVNRIQYERSIMKNGGET